MVTDDGKGFNTQLINSGNGLKNMQDRAKTLKGKLIIETGQGNGTAISLTVPIN